MTTTLKPRRRGPLLVEGDFEVYDVDGAPLLVGARRVLLCRCGASAHPPLCDGCHNRTPFEAPNDGGDKRGGDEARVDDATAAVEGDETGHRQKEQGE